MGNAAFANDQNSNLEALEEGDLSHLSPAEKRTAGQPFDAETLMRSGPGQVGRLPGQSAATLFGRGYKRAIPNK